MGSDKKIPVWLDCDPGHDDAFAILLAAYHPKIELLGISTVFGNASVDKTTLNASSILTAIGKHKTIPLHPGALNPMARPPMHAPTSIHGATGLDGTALLPRGLAPVQADVPAVEAMAAALRCQPAGAAHVVATGALTNVARLFAAHPDLADRVGGVSLMGGAIGGGFSPAVLGVVDGRARIGNWTEFAEFNIVVDPEAAAAVLEHPVLQPKTTMVPLDLTHQVLATAAVRDLLLHGPEGPPPPPPPPERERGGDGANGGAAAVEGKSTLRKMLVELLMYFAKTYDEVFGISQGPPLHDPLAVAAVLTGTDEEIKFYDYERGAADPGSPPCPPERYHVKVVTEGSLEEAHQGGAELGRTIATKLPPGTPGVRIPRGLDVPRFWKVVEECIQRADEANAEATSAAGS